LAGALLVTGFGPSLPAYAAGIFALGLICDLLRLDRPAYRFAGVTLTVVMLIAHAHETVWVTAFHRFAEVSVGIAVGVIVIALWPDSPASGEKTHSQKQ
jgi:uncharacterized membrane protein YccC